MISIRPYQQTDEGSVIALWNAAGIARPWYDMPADIREKIKRDPELFLLAIDDGRVIGSLMGAYDGHRGWLHHLAVAHDRQRQGIGSALVREVEAAMAAIGVGKENLQVRTGNLGVIDFYSKLGYGDDQVIGLGKWLTPPERGSS